MGMKFNSKHSKSNNIDVSLPTEKQVSDEMRRLKYRSLYRKAIKSTIYSLLIVAAVAVLISSIVLPVMQISGNSMEPILQSNDIVVLVKTKSFGTGDLVCFTWNNKTLVKRVIAGPGDWVNIEKDGTVLVNGDAIKEDYVQEPGLGECDTTFPVQIPENSYWVMGDKRVSSIDSRSSVIGYVNKEQIVGKVIMRAWPLKRFSFI